MFNISDFLDKISKKLKSQEIYKKGILEIIERNTNIKISNDDLEIKDYIVYIKSSPAVKNKIFISKESLINEINNTLGIKITDIR